MKGSPAPTPEVYGTVQRSGDHYAAPLLLVQRFPWGRGFESRSVQKLERRLQSSKVATLKWYSHITPAARITVLGSIHYTATHVEGTPAPTHLWGVLWRELLPWPTWGELCGGNSCPDPLGGSYVEGTPAPTPEEYGPTTAQWSRPLLLLHRFPCGCGFDSRSVLKLEARLQSSKLNTILG